MDKTHRRMEKSCFFPYILFHSIPPCFRIEKGRVGEAPPHAFPIGRREQNIKGGGMTFLKYRSLLKVRKKGGRFYSARAFFRYNKKSALIGGNQGEKEKVKCKERRVKEEKS